MLTAADFKPGAFSPESWCELFLKSLRESERQRLVAGLWILVDVDKVRRENINPLKWRFRKLGFHCENSEKPLPTGGIGFALSIRVRN